MRIYYPGTPGMPEGASELRLEQLEAIYRMKRVVEDGIVIPGTNDEKPHRSVLVGAGMGSGKTVAAVEVILHTSPERCLIVGVRDAYGQWAEAMEDQQHAGNLTGPGAMFGIKRKIHRIARNTKAGRLALERFIAGEPGVYYAGLEALRASDWSTVSETLKTNPNLKDILGEEYTETFDVQYREQSHTFKKMRKVDLLISDESHKHSNQKSASIKTVRSIPATAKIALSGTFFGNKFENAWSLTTWLWGKDVIGTKGSWEKKYVEKAPVMSKDGRRQLTSRYGHPLTKTIGERNPGEFVNSLPCYVFMPTPIGKPPEPEIVKIDLHPEQLRQYQEMEGQSLTWIPTTDGGRAPLVADLPLTQRIRLRTAALGGMTLIPSGVEDEPDTIMFAPGTPSSTLVALYDILHRKDWVGQKALILTHSKSFAEETARRIGKKYTVALKTGSTKPGNWDDEKRRFMLPIGHPESIQYLVAVISAVGTATDGLQRNCSRVVWVSEDDNNANNVQGANRIWRAGVDLENYHAVKIIQRGTISEGILKKNNEHRDRTMDSVAG